jgi:hypothetical protein
LPNHRYQAHKDRGDHEFRIPRTSELGFPQHSDHHNQCIRLQQGFDSLEAADARFVVHTNIPDCEADQDAPHDFIPEMAQTAFEFHRSSQLFHVFPSPHFWQSYIQRRTRQEGPAAFEETPDDRVGCIHSVNLFTNAGAALGFNVLHAIELKLHS